MPIVRCQFLRVPAGAAALPAFAGGACAQAYFVANQRWSSDPAGGPTEVAGRMSDLAKLGQNIRRVAVFGNAGAGKSRLSRRLAEITGLPLYTLDLIQFRDGSYRPEEKDGGKIPHEEYLKIHKDILLRDQWIIDGYGCVLAPSRAGFSSHGVICDAAEGTSGLPRHWPTALVSINRSEPCRTMLPSPVQSCSYVPRA
jgi:hypothetical protein